MFKKLKKIIKERIERQELWCHECSKYVQFDMDLSVDGNHVLECPNCGHEHCRVVKNGKITDIRWDSRNGPNIPTFAVTFTSSSTWDTSRASSIFLYSAWMDSNSSS